MNYKLRGLIFAFALLAFGLTVSMKLARAQAGSAASAPAPQAAAGGAPQLAEAKFKNIQALKGIPADQVIPAMQFISNSLGVECEYCHVHNAFDKDDKEKKKTARKMIQMEFAINKDNFDGHTQVTCNSCHRGAEQPAGVPMVAENDIPRMPMPPGPNAAGASPAPAVPAGPPADQILEKYLQAVGGADALNKISSRVEKGTIAFGDRHNPIEVYAKAPDKRLSVSHMQNGESLTAFDGHVGWLGNTGRPPREMEGAEIDAARLDADFYFPVHVKQLFTQFRVRPPEKIGDREAYAVFGLKQGQPPVRLYFDEESGLLVRLVRYAETPLGRNPTQIDYADYRDVDGVKLPFRWTLSRPNGRFTIQVDSVQQNVPIDDAKFAEPPAPPPPLQTPAGH
jgi:photosynthetic reaction center cytochrome c subunit